MKRLKEIAGILQVNFVSMIGEDETYIQQNFHQQGGYAATQMLGTAGEKEVYEKLVSHLNEEILFLRGLVKK